MSAVNKVLVAGGGIGGLTAAVGLRRQGIAVDLVEANPDHSVYGVGIIQPNNTLRALDRIGLAAECVRHGGSFDGWQLYDHQGNFLIETSSGRQAAPGYPAMNGITRPLLQRILLDAARDAGAAVRVGVAIDRLDDRGDVIEVGFTDGGTCGYDFVVGCDGLNSDLRSRLFPDVPAPQFSGQAVWRYNFERPATLDHGHVYFGTSTKIGLVPISPVLMYMFLVSHEPDNPRFPRARLADLMRERLAEYGGLVAELRDKIVDPEGVVYRPMEHLMLPSPWWKGRAIVIGDAAHATTPHLSQGAAMAIEDAVLLAELLGRDGALEPLLDEFMRRRFDRSKYVVDTSSQLANWELEQWQTRSTVDARPGKLMHEAAELLMADY